MTDQKVLQFKVLMAIRQSKFDWRTTTSLVNQLSDFSRAEVVGALDGLFQSRLIRHPVDFSVPELEWWRPVDKGYTRGEKWRMVKALFGMYPVSNGEADGSIY